MHTSYFPQDPSSSTISLCVGAVLVPVLIRVESHPQLAPGQPVQSPPHPTHPQPLGREELCTALLLWLHCGHLCQRRAACATSHNGQHAALPLPRGWHLHTTCGQFHTALRTVPRGCSFVLRGTHVSVRCLTTLQRATRARLPGPMERPLPAACKNGICELQVCGLGMWETLALPCP